MYRVLVPVDGSRNALAGVAHALRLCAARSVAEVWVVNVQPVLPRHVSRFVSRRASWEARVSRGRDALRDARQLVEGAGIPCRAVVLRGAVAPVVARLARDEGIDQIVLGASRATAIMRLVSGAVTNRILELAEVPVVVVAGDRPSAWRRYGIPAGLGAGLAAILLTVE